MEPQRIVIVSTLIAGSAPVQIATAQVLRLFHAGLDIEAIAYPTELTRSAAPAYGDEVSFLEEVVPVNPRTHPRFLPFGVEELVSALLMATEAEPVILVDTVELRRRLAQAFHHACRGFPAQFATYQTPQELQNPRLLEYKREHVSDFRNTVRSLDCIMTILHGLDLVASGWKQACRLQPSSDDLDEIDLRWRGTISSYKTFAQATDLLFKSPLLRWSEAADNHFFRDFKSK